MAFHDVSLDTLYATVQGSEKGLSTEEAQRRLLRDGRNELKVVKGSSPLTILLSQFNDFLIWILFGAAIISGAIGEWIDAAVIAVILVLNALLGFFQEYRAEKAIEKLSLLTSPKAMVLRDGQATEIAAAEVVVGDVLLLSEGTKICADARLIEAYSLAAIESSLTGESTPVEKKIGIVSASAQIADRNNMVFTGTSLTRGRARAVVVSTGMHTELGKIAGLISETPRMETPLKISLARFGRTLGGIVLAICGLVLALGLLRGNEPMVMLLAAISLAVAAVPEGLPAVVTITLSLGVQRMASRNALIRHLPAVETLGSTTVICSDKTGTLTHDQMTVVSVYVDDTVLSVSGEGYDAHGTFSGKSKDLGLLLTIGTLCNNASLNMQDGRVKILGDPTEAALLISAKKGGLDREVLEKNQTRTNEYPFSSERKMMSTIHGSKRNSSIYTKGAVDNVLAHCNRIVVKGKVHRLDKTTIKRILKQNDLFASQALRVLAFAYGPGSSQEKDLIFVGLQAMIDPPRQEVVLAIKKCQDAGIKVVMITGDHALTAQAIASQMGIGNRVMTGQDLEKNNLSEIVEDIDIYARVNPEHKLRIVEALQHKGHVVAMTGDGVNDAPALKKADIGVAMGITGTDVTKEASVMVLADDNFASLVAAVEEGRNIFDNICKFVEYLLSSNMAEVLVVVLSILVGLPLPLVAVMILWMNLLTDGLPAVALGLNPGEPDTMSLSPRKRGHSVLTSHAWMRMGAVAGLISIGTLGAFGYALYGSSHAGQIDYARSIAFCTLVLFELWNVVNYRSIHSIFRSGIRGNPYLWAAIGTSLALQLLVVYVLSGFFDTVRLGVLDWAWILAVSSSVFLIVEIAKNLGMWSARTRRALWIRLPHQP